MSTLLRSALAESITFESIVDPDTAITAFAMEQMTLQDRQQRQIQLQVELDELKAAQRTLEGREKLHQSNESLSIESFIATRTILSDLFGEETLSEVSFESEDAQAATLESISTALKRIARAVRSKYDKLLESIRWVSDSMFNGLTKSDTYLTSALKSLSTLGELKDAGDYTSPSLATNYLHFNGNGDVVSVLKGLRQSTEAFKTLSSSATTAKRELLPLARRSANRVLEELGQAKTKSEIGSIIERIYAETLEEAGKVTSTHRKQIENLTGMHVSGGRVIQYKSARKFGDSPDIKLDIVPGRGRTPDSLTLPTKSDLSELIGEAKLAIESLRARKSDYDGVFNSFIDLLGEEVTDKDIGKPDKQAEEFWGVDLWYIYVFIMMSFYFGLMATVMPAVAIISTGFALAALVKTVTTVWSAITGKYSKGHFGTDKDTTNEMLKDEIKGPIADLAGDLVKVMNDYARFQNTVVRASVLYIHSALEQYGSTSKDPLS
jgi:hypothetical protein